MLPIIPGLARYMTARAFSILQATGHLSGGGTDRQGRYVPGPADEARMAAGLRRGGRGVPSPGRPMSLAEAKARLAAITRGPGRRPAAPVAGPPGFAPNGAVILRF